MHLPPSPRPSSAWGEGERGEARLAPTMFFSAGRLLAVAGGRASRRRGEVDNRHDPVDPVDPLRYRIHSGRVIDRAPQVDGPALDRDLESGHRLSALGDDLLDLTLEGGLVEHRARHADPVAHLVDRAAKTTELGVALPRALLDL